MAAPAEPDHTDAVGSARPTAPRTRAHRIVVETPRATAVDSLAQRAGKHGTCTVEHRGDGSASLALDFVERPATGARETSRLPRILGTVERWLHQQSVTAVTVWIDGRRFEIVRRDAYRRAPMADLPITRDRTAQELTARSAPPTDAGNRSS
jgi:hypothetical protein